ncbi:hypothetical protein FQA47_025135 [Oryzias melastigma]|uniref:Uncharacterized protein n=1 Tax=Oryzias melastigma TaxID=30732 RepID=A0A834F9X4_ORYME|nr:hypothetical protein FQA47_025135 [Oryzias melastigma]
MPVERNATSVAHHRVGEKSLRLDRNKQIDFWISSRRNISHRCAGWEIPSRFFIRDAFISESGLNTLGGSGP